MEKLRTYINGLAIRDQEIFSARCGTTIGYLRNAMSSGKRLGETICINVERESQGAVRCEDLRADVDWAYLRATDCGPSCHKAA